MGFVGRTRMTMGPRGRNVSTYRTATAMGYVRDDHAFTRGPGAIAALDAASPKRRIARARQLGEDARRDAARARTTMGALPLLPALHAAAAIKTLMPGQRLVPVKPGTVVPAKYPGIRGYHVAPAVGPTQYGKAPGYRPPSGAVTGGVRGGIRTSSNLPSTILGTSGPGSMSPGSASLPTAGNVNPITGQVDPGSAGGGGPAGDPGSGSGGGGGGGGTLPDGTDAADGGTDDTTQSTDPGDPGGGGGGMIVDPAPVDPTAIATTPSSSTTHRNLLIAGAVLLGGYWLLKKH